MKKPVEDPTPQQVLTEFSRLTGISYRVMNHGMEAQAMQFVRAGFSLDDLGAVVGWIQRKIASGDKRMDERSLSWRNVMGEYGSGNEFGTFQDRLAMSRKQVRVRPPAREVPVARVVDGTGVIVAFQPAPEPDIATIAAEAHRLADEFRQKMKGGA